MRIFVCVCLCVSVSLCASVSVFLGTVSNTYKIQWYKGLWYKVQWKKVLWYKVQRYQALWYQLQWYSYPESQRVLSFRKIGGVKSILRLNDLCMSHVIWQSIPWHAYVFFDQRWPKYIIVFEQEIRNEVNAEGMIDKRYKCQEDHSTALKCTQWLFGTSVLCVCNIAQLVQQLFDEMDVKNVIIVLTMLEAVG